MAEESDTYVSVPSLSRGWFTIDVSGGEARERYMLELDFGHGFSEYTSLRLWPSAMGMSCVARVHKQARQARIRARTCAKLSGLRIAITPLKRSSLWQRRCLEAVALLTSGQWPKCFSHDRDRRPFLRYLSFAGFFSFPTSWAIHSNYEEWLYRTEALGEKPKPTGPQAPRLNVLLLAGRHSHSTPTCVRAAISQLTEKDRLVVIATTGRAEDISLADIAHLSDGLEVSIMRAGTEVADILNAACDISYEGTVVIQSNHELGRDCLALIRNGIGNGYDFVYGDDDEKNRSKRERPRFRCRFSPEFLYFGRDLGPIYAVRTEALRRVGGWRRREGRALHLEFQERLSEARCSFLHCAHILAHRLSDATNPSNGDTANQLRKNRCWPLPANPSTTPLVSVIIPTRDRLPLLRRAVESIREKTGRHDYEIIVVDNRSRETETRNWLAHGEAAGILSVMAYDDEFNFSAMNNKAVQLARAPLIAFINNDVEIESPGWIDEMGKHALRPDIGCVGARLLYANGRIQHDGIALGIGGVAGHPLRGLRPDRIPTNRMLAGDREVAAVTGAFLVMRKALFLEVGGFDADNLPVSFNDVDLCLRVREKGYRNLVLGSCRHLHHESASRTEDDIAETTGRFAAEIAYMRSRWGSLLDDDPCYSPCLSLKRDGAVVRL